MLKSELNEAHQQVAPDLGMTRLQGEAILMPEQQEGKEDRGRIPAEPGCSPKISGRILADAEHQAGSNQPEDPGLPTLAIARVLQRDEVAKAGIEQIKSRPVLRENILVKEMTLGMVDECPENVPFVIVAGPSAE